MEIDGIVLVVGAGAIGSEIASTLATHDAKALISADIKLEAAQKTVESVLQTVAEQRSDLETLALQADVTSEKSVQDLIDAVKSKYGRIDYFVNAPGFAPVEATPISSYTLDQYRSLNDMHNVGSFLLLRSVLACMQSQELRSIPLPGRRKGSSSGRSRSRGSIVMLASASSEGAVQGIAGCIAAKHAVKGLVRTAALENGPLHIRVNAVSPSNVSGPMTDRYFDDQPAAKAEMLSVLPLGRLADPEEVADTVAFLCSGLSSYINGHTLVVDGGALVSLIKGQYKSE